MVTGCDTHKIMDHMDNSQISRWLEMFDVLLAQNPSLITAEFHFFCTDSDEPYYFLLVKDAHLSMRARAKGTYAGILVGLDMHTGSADSLYYMRPRAGTSAALLEFPCTGTSSPSPKDECDDYDEYDGSELVFHERLYASNLDKIPFRRVPLYLRSGGLW